MRLAGRSAIVTGGAGDVGQSVVERFTAEGAGVAVADLDAGAAEALARQLRGQGRRVLAVGVDVADRDSVDVMIAAAQDALGGLDILVNAASLVRSAPLMEVTDADWAAQLAVNLTGAFLCSRAAVRRMAEADGGRIVNVISVEHRRAIGGRGAYAVTQGGVAMLTRALATEVAPFAVTVNAVAVSLVDPPAAPVRQTPAVRRAWRRALPIKRYADPGDVAGAVQYLASDEAAYVTGHVLAVDGGFDAAGVLLEP